MKITPILFSVLVLSLFLASSASAYSSPNSTGRPFYGGFAGNFIADTATSFSGSVPGIFTHLGHVTFEFSVVITGMTASGCIVSTETDTIVSASGDKLFLTAPGSVGCPTSSPGINSVSGPFYITGGTGRFVDSSGAGSFVGFANFNSFTLGAILTGTISF